MVQEWAINLALHRSTHWNPQGGRLPRRLPRGKWAKYRSPDAHAPLLPSRLQNRRNMLGTIPPAAVVATGTGAAASLGDQRTDPPAWWRVAPRAAWGGTAPSRATRTALALADGTGPANFQDPRREGPRSVAKWSAPLETKFLLFWTGQERDSVPSWSRHRAFHSRCLSLRAANDSVASNLAGSGLRAPARYLDRRLPASSTVGARQSDRACLFASGEASGSQRVRFPPQVGS